MGEGAGPPRRVHAWLSRSVQRDPGCLQFAPPQQRATSGSVDYGNPEIINALSKDSPSSCCPGPEGQMGRGCQLESTSCPCAKLPHDGRGTETWALQERGAQSGKHSGRMRAGAPHFRSWGALANSCRLPTPTTACPAGRRLCSLEPADRSIFRVSAKASGWAWGSEMPERMAVPGSCCAPALFPPQTLAVPCASHRHWLTRSRQLPCRCFALVTPLLSILEDKGGCARLGGVAGHMGMSRVSVPLALSPTLGLHSSCRL